MLRARDCAIVLLLLSAMSLTSGRLAAAASPSPSAPKGPTATFGIGPASATRADGRPFLNVVASPGSRLTDHVAVLNISPRPQQFSLYVTDASNDLDGGFSYPLPGKPPAEAGGWIRLPGVAAGAAKTIVVGAGKTAIFPLSIEVPANAGPGDHAAAVIVSLKAISRSATGQRVTLDQRVAVKAFFRVSGPVRAKLEVQRLTAEYEGTGIFAGTVTTTYRVHNAGNVKLAGRQLVHLSGLFTSRDERPADVPVLLPRGSLLVTTVTKGVHPFVWMTSKVSVTPLGIQGDATAPSSVATAEVRFRAIPWLLLLAVLLVVLLGTVWKRMRRRRAAGPQAGPQPAAPTAPLTPAPAAAAPLVRAPRPSPPVAPPRPVVTAASPAPIAEPDPIPEDWSTPYASGFEPVVESTDR